MAHTFQRTLYQTYFNGEQKESQEQLHKPGHIFCINWATSPKAPPGAVDKGLAIVVNLQLANRHCKNVGAIHESPAQHGPAPIENYQLIDGFEEVSAMKWSEMSALYKVLRIAVILFLIAGLTLIFLDESGTVKNGSQYAIILLGAANLFMGIESWKSRKTYAIFSFAVGALMIISQIFILAR